MCLNEQTFVVCAFQAAIDEQVIIGQNFIVAHDLHTLLGAKKIVIHKDSFGADLDQPLELPYELSDAQGMSAYQVYVPVRNTAALELRPGQQLHLSGSDLQCASISFARGALLPPS